MVKFNLISILLVLLCSAECRAEIVAKKHVQVIQTKHKEYMVEMGGYQDGTNSRSPMGYTPFSVKFQPNESLEIENIGGSTIINPKLIVNGTRNWGSIDDILASIITDSMTVDEKVRAIFEFTRKNSFHFYGLAHNDTSDPVKIFNIYGYNICSGIVTATLALLDRLGLETYTINFSGHIVYSVFYDNAHHLFDGDRKVYYLSADNKTVASDEELFYDHYLIKRTHIYGILSPDDYKKSALEASIYFNKMVLGGYYIDNGILGRKRKFKNPLKKNQYHTMDYSLRPGEKIVFNWRNIGKSNTLSKLDPKTRNMICNGKMVYKPNIHLETLKPDSSLIYEIKSPYVIVGGNIEGIVDKEISTGNVYFSYDRKKWTQTPFTLKTGEPNFIINLDKFFPPALSPAAYKYYVKIEPNTNNGKNNTGIKEISFNTDVQMAYLSLPALRLGTNHIIYTDQTNDPHKLKITHQWKENYDNNPPGPPKTPVFPADSGRVSNIPFEFSWQQASDQNNDVITDYHFQLSNRKDMGWPLSANFNKLISNTSTKGMPKYKIPFPGLLNSGERYYWRVKAQDSAGLWSKWSNTWSFIPSGPKRPIKLRLEESANTLKLVWGINSSNEQAEIFEVYGSDEKGFTPSRSEYSIISSTYHDQNNRLKYHNRRFSSNLVDTVKSNRYTIIDPNDSQKTEPKAYYRIAAVGRNGSRSPYSDIIEISRPLIYSRPVSNISPNTPYKYYIKSIRSMGDLVGYSTNYKTDYSYINDYVTAYKIADDLQFSLLLTPDWMKIKKIDSKTALIYGTPQKYNDNVTTRIIALVIDNHTMKFDIQMFKVQGNYQNNYFKFINNSLQFLIKYLKAKIITNKIAIANWLKRTYWLLY